MSGVAKDDWQGENKKKRMEGMREGKKEKSNDALLILINK